MAPNKRNPESANEEILEFPCLTVEQGEYTLYAFVISARSLWDIVRINRRDPDKETGYQRALSPSRVKAIANFIDKGNPIPNSILLALDDVEVADGGTKLLIPRRDDVGWVIDGQHRLAGAKEAESDIEFLAVAFVRLSLEQQIQQFIVVNREAKGVPTSLYYDLLKHLPLPKSTKEVSEERAADIANDLRKDENSTVFNRVVIANPKKGQISLTNFVRKVAPLVRDGSGKFYTYTYHEQRGILYNYFKALENVFPKQFTQKTMTFFRTLGFGATINFLPTVFDLSLKHYYGFKIENVVEILRKIDYYDFSQWRIYGTGSAAELQAGEDLRTELLKILEQTSTPGSLEL